MASTPPSATGLSSVKPMSKLSALRTPEQQTPTHAPAPTPAKKSFRWVWFVPLAMMGMGYVIGGFFVKAAPKAANEEHHAEEHHTDPTIDETLAEQRWKDALGKIRTDLKTAAGPENTALRFREGICQEKLGDHLEAGKSYSAVIAAEPNTVRGTAARISWARCQIKLDRLAEARAALYRLVLVSGSDGKTSSPLHADLLATIAHVEYLSGGINPTPYPLNPYLPATTEKIPDLEQLVVWAGPLRLIHAKKHHASGHGEASHSHDPGHEESTPHDSHASDSHDKKPASKHDDHAADDHGKKPASKHDDHAADDHGKKAEPKKDEHATDPHAKKAEPKKDEHSKDSHDEKPKPKKDEHTDDPDTEMEISATTGDDSHGAKPLPPKAPAAPAKGELRIARGPKPDEWLVTADLLSRGLRNVVETMARELGLAFKLNGNAEELLSGRAANISVSELPSGLMLDALLSPAGLEWTIQDHDLVISPIKESEAAWGTRTKTALNRALTAGPEHPWRIGQIIDLGNLDFLAKNWKGASETFTRALDEGGLRPEAVAANYNLGVTCVHLGLRDKAREQFQNLADRDTAGRWSSLAYWWAGRTHLDVDEPERAVKFFEAAIDTGETGPAVTASALGLAFCHLIRNDYAATLATLRPHKVELKAPDFKLAAAFADALCRFKLAENPRVTGEADELLYAVLNAGEQSAVGPAGIYVLGKTCRELGFGPRMVVMYEQSLETLRGDLAVRMTRELADYQFADGDPAKAVEGYKAVAAISREEPGRHAWVQLARLAVRANHPEDAARYCVEAMRAGAEKSAVLKELGRAYELKKDYKRAAKCFGGEFP
ncbi:tetratricopeptide repeat protein [Zavarzinella formosa]|uniref:tetratricopeptide repeat protein n=1 Tax=Zavarzinella formosa TaxID=360055 RepID=UPI0002D27C6E|nr:tetratricopeptide repeat protein [Zavarzinella formosa]